MSEFARWAAEQPKTEKGQIDARLLIDESKRRGYCVCYRPMRQLVDFSSGWEEFFTEPLTCKWCHQPETKGSWEFWYAADVPQQAAGEP